MDAVINFEKLSNKHVKFLSQLFENLKDKYELTNDMFFQWAQLKHAIPTKWKKKLIFNFGGIDEKNLITLLKEHEFCLPIN